MTDSPRVIRSVMVVWAALSGVFFPIPGFAQTPALCSAPPTGSAKEWLGRARSAVGIQENQVLHFKSIYRQSMNFQSDRSDPPFFSAYDVLETWFDPSTGTDRTLAAQVYVGSGPDAPRGFVTTPRSTWAETPKGLREIPPFHPMGLTRRNMNPWAVLHDWSVAPPAANVVGMCAFRGEERVTLETGGPWGPERLFLDVETALPVGTERVAPHITWGQRLVQTVWSTWFEASGIYLPASAHLLADGDVEFERTLGFAEMVTPREASVPGLPDQVAGGAPEDPWLEAWTKTAPDTVRVSADAVVLQHPAYNSMLVRVADTVFVLDAPLSEARARQDSMWAAALFPDSHHRVLIVTDLAWPHVGGLRFWVARGARVVSHSWSRGLLERLVDRSWVLVPDALERGRAIAPAPLLFSGIDDPANFGGGSLILAPIDGRASEGAIMVYMPHDRLLWAGDFVQRVDAPSLYAKDVIAAVLRNGLTPDRLAAHHLDLTNWRAVLDANPSAR